MCFVMKNTLKSNHNHTLKHPQEGEGKLRKKVL